ncbi:hypothetical protein CR513_35917, partial [Mucuna pruriens]
MSSSSLETQGARVSVVPCLESSSHILVRNGQRLKRHIVQSAMCSICTKRPKSIIHLMRDCIKDIVPHLIDIIIRWFPLTLSFVKVNSNGTVNKTSGEAIVEGR